MIASGVSSTCGRSARRRATSLVEKWWMSLPSSTTEPPFGFSSRESARSVVDFPQPFGPISTVILPSGTSIVRSVATVRLS